MWVDRRRAPAVGRAAEAGRPYRISRPAWTRYDMVRVEAGLHHERRGLLQREPLPDRSRKSTPYEAGLGWTVKLERDRSSGRPRCAPRRKQRGCAGAFVGLESTGTSSSAVREARPAAGGLPAAPGATRPVYDRRPGVRSVQATSGSWSPILKKNLALATVEAPRARQARRRAPHRGHRGVRARHPVKATTVVERRRSSIPKNGGSPGPDGEGTGYDASSSAAATTDWSARRTWRKAGRRCWCWSAGTSWAAPRSARSCTPGFKFSVCSYVVSLFPAAHHPRAGAGRVTGWRSSRWSAPSSRSPDGFALARWADPHRTRREIARSSPAGCRGLPGVRPGDDPHAHFAKDIIDSPAPDPTSLDPRELAKLLRLGKMVPRASPPDLMHLNLQLLTMSAVDFLDLWFESACSRRRCRSAGSSARFWACGRRAPRTSCCTTTWARSTGPSARGASRRAAPDRSAWRSPPRREELRRGDPHGGRVERCW